MKAEGGLFGLIHAHLGCGMGLGAVRVHDGGRALISQGHATKPGAAWTTGTEMVIDADDSVVF